jgi:hypothetical protein
MGKKVIFLIPEPVVISPILGLQNLFHQLLSNNWYLHHSYDQYYFLPGTNFRNVVYVMYKSGIGQRWT